MLDTGANNIMLDQKLADELALPQGKATTIIGANGSRSLSAVYAESLSIAGAMVDGKELFLFASTIPQGLPSKVRGVPSSSPAPSNHPASLSRCLGSGRITGIHVSLCQQTSAHPAERNRTWRTHSPTRRCNLLLSILVVVNIVDARIEIPL